MHKKIKDIVTKNSSNFSITSQGKYKIANFTKDIVTLLPELCKTMGQDYLAFLQEHVSFVGTTRVLELGPDNDDFWDIDGI